MKINELVSEAIPGVAPVVKGIANLVKPSAKTLAKRAAQGSKELDYQASKQIIRAEWDVLAKKVWYVANTLMWIGMLRPFYTYWRAISDAQTKLDSGEWTQDNFNYVRQTEMSKLIVALVAGFSTKLVFSSFNGTMHILSKLPILKTFTPLYKMLTTLDKTAQVALIAFLNTDKGRTWLAKLAVADVFAGTPLEFNVAEWLGGTGVYFVDQIKSALGLNDTKPTSSPTDSATSAAAGGKQAADTDAGQQQKSQDKWMPQSYDAPAASLDDYEIVNNVLMRDKSTGKLVPRTIF